MKYFNAFMPCVFALVCGQVCAQAYGELDINDVRARFYSEGRVSYDPATGPHFEVPQGSGVNALFAGGIWVGGRTADSLIHLAVFSHGQDSMRDFFPGPLRTDGSATTTDPVSQQYDHVWSANAADIALHEAYFACLSDPNCNVAVEFPGYTIPPYFYDWPAINTNAGYDGYLAPFIDLNADGDYNPSDGDAPCITGDQALFFVFNDGLSAHTESGALPIGIEVQAMAFEYHGVSRALDNTVFVRYHLINRSTNTVHETRIGFYNDFDLGCPDDDYTGCDVGRNLAYVYNWDGLDDDCPGALGYGVQPPAVGQVFLKGPLLDQNSQDDIIETSLPAWNGSGFGDGINDNERTGMMSFMRYSNYWGSCCIDPGLPEHYLNYLNAMWRDGTLMTYGGNGHSTDPNAIPARFMYPAGSDPYGVGVDGPPQPAWQDSLMASPDPRGVASMGPFTLDPGEHVDILTAYVFARADSGGAWASVGALQQRVDSVKAFTNTLPMMNALEDAPWNSCSGTNVGITKPQTNQVLSLYPVPATDHVQLNASAELMGAVLEVRDALGRMVRSQRLTTGRNTIDLFGIARGTYTCVVQSRNTRYTARLLKQ